ncbi:HAD-IC family P-type ATPase [soil metagenome]
MEPKGLTSSEVEKITAAGEINKATKHRSKTISQIILENIFSVFNLVILAVILFLLYFYFRTGDQRLILDTIGAGTTALLNLILAIFQEIKAKLALDKVNLLLKKEVSVIRDSKTILIDQEKVVKGDTIAISRGDQVIVDGRVLFSNHLEIDESLLTGESVPIIKNQNSEVLSGSFCLSGNGFYEAEKVGDNSFAEGITGTAKKYKFGKTPLQKKIDLTVKVLFLISIILVLFEVLDYPQYLHEINIEFIRRISTIILSLIPQGLVLLASVSFAIGVYRISRIGAIVQKLNAIESFSNIQVVCMDKTGTLTKNKLSVQRIENLSGIEDSELELLLGTYAKFSSDKNATLNTLNKFSASENASVINEIPFSSENKMSMLQLNIRGKVRILVLGGFDIIINSIESNEKDKAIGVFKNEKLKVYRNLMLGEITDRDSLTGIELKNVKIEPLAIISISDEIRDDVLSAIELFQKNGVKFKILSGDAPEAVQAVVKEIGWDIDDSQLITGIQLDEVKNEDFYKCISERSIFARLRPEHKLRIIKELKAHKNYTAMIGDGVNDLPAIKEADMGIAMEEGSSITKEIADIVLLQNKFSLMPEIFDEGNKIVNSVLSVAKLFLTKNFIVIFMTLLSLAFSLDFPVTPRRIALLNVFAIGLPSFLITFRNTNVQKCTNFVSDLFSFVFISSVFITLIGYFGRFLFRKVFDIHDNQELQMIMVDLVIITSITNFLAIVLTKEEKGRRSGTRRIYLGYAFFLISIYLFLSFTSFHFVITDFLKEFYEIYYLQPKYVPMILLFGIISSVSLFILQKIRSKYIKKFSEFKLFS